MKSSIDLNTGLLIESQSHADDSTLIANAAAAGFVNVEVRVVSDAELETLIAARDTSRMTLNDAQKNAHIAIDIQAGITRTKYVTDAPGQDATYLSKAADAESYKAAGYPAASIANYPWLQAEAEAIANVPDGTVLSAAQYQAAADGILATRAQWCSKPVGPAIEKQRRSGKLAVSACATVADVQSARDSAIAALKAM